MALWQVCLLPYYPYLSNETQGAKAISHASYWRGVMTQQGLLISPCSTFFEKPKKRHSPLQFSPKYQSCCCRARECLCWEITGKINKTNSWQVSSWHSRRCHCELIHHEWVRTVMSLNILLCLTSLVFFLPLSPSTLTIIYFISGIYKCFSAS